MRNTDGSIRSAVMLIVMVATLGSVSSCNSGDSQSGDSQSRNWLDPADSTQVVALTAQQTVCLDCLQMTHLATLGDTVGQGYVEGTNNVVRDSLGRYWLNQGKRLKVFGENGTYVGEVGRPGQGPMEFSLPLPISTDAAGNVHVLDPINVRETVISPRFESVRETPLPQGELKNAASLPGGHRYAANVWMATAGQIGLPLHVIDGARIVASFGADSSTGGPLNPFTSLRLLTTDDAGRIFSAKRFDYDIEAWTSGGRQIVGFQAPKLNALEVRWAPYNFDDNPLPSEIKDLQSDGRNRLWVLSWRVKPDWERHFVRHVYPNGQVGLQLKTGSDMDSVYSSRIDVIDLRHGTFVAQWNQEGLLTGFVGHGLLFQNLARPDGTPQISIWQASMHESDS